MATANEIQKLFFYGANWTEEYDVSLINNLKEQCYSDFGCVPLNNSRFLDMIVNNATDYVNLAHNTTYTSDEILSRFENLAARHQCFRMILGHPEVAWDYTKNVVHASNDLWDVFIKKDPEAEAYRENGEFAWKDLAKLFGKSPIRAKVFREEIRRTSAEILEKSRRLSEVPYNPRNGEGSVCDRMSNTDGVRRVVDLEADLEERNRNANAATHNYQGSCSAKSFEF